MGLFGGGGNNTQNSRLLGYRVQTSIAGSAVKIVFGTNRVSGNVIWVGDWKAKNADGKAGKGKYGGNYTYQSAGIMALCSGPVSGIVSVWSNQVKNGQQDTSYLNPYTVSDLGLTSFTGALGQAPWGYLTSNHPDQALGYSELAYIAKADWDLGSSGVFPNYSYEVAGFNLFGGGPDALVSQVIYRLLTDASIGAGFDPSEVNIDECELYCMANSLVVSPVMDQQKSAAEWINQLLLISNCEAVWSEGILKIRTRGDQAATANGATFTPNLTPVMDLTEDDYKDADEPVRISRPDPRDAYNAVTVNWTNRGNQYNTEPCPEMDQALIDTYGYRPASAIDALGICRADVAAKVAHVQLLKNTTGLAKYKVKLGWEHILLEPMDIVSLTCFDAVRQIYYQNLNQTPVRITSLEEDEDGYLACEAEELGVATATLHPKQTVGGFSAPLGAAPGDVTVPIFYEGSREMRQSLYGTPYALLIALSGGPNWGGCTVHRSYDGSSYEAVGRQVGATPTGILTAGLGVGADPDTSDTLAVDLLQSFGQLDTVTQADADNFKTVSVLGGGDTSELVSYQTATLTTKYGYDLTYLRRGVYGSTIQSHSAGDAYFLVKNAFPWIYQAQDVHKTIYFKFTSFNQYGNSEQNLADVTAYSYTLTGGLSGIKTVTTNYTLQPSDVGLNVDTSAGSVTITIPASLQTVNTQTTITKISSDGNSVNVVGSALSGEATTTITRQYESQTIQSTNQQWVVISKTPPKFADDETPAGAIDGTNQTFTLFAAPSPSSSLNLYLNGIWLRQGAGFDYTLSGNTITLLWALPNAGDALRASYRY